MVGFLVGEGVFAKFLVREHRFANVDATIVDHVDAEDAGAGFFEDFCDGDAERVVSHVSEVKRLVRVRSGEFDQDFFAGERGNFGGSGKNFAKKRLVSEKQVQILPGEFDFFEFGTGFEGFCEFF